MCVLIWFRALTSKRLPASRRISSLLKRGEIRVFIFSSTFNPYYTEAKLLKRGELCVMDQLSTLERQLGGSWEFTHPVYMFCGLTIVSLRGSCGGYFGRMGYQGHPVLTWIEVTTVFVVLAGSQARFQFELASARVVPCYGYCSGFSWTGSQVAVGRRSVSSLGTSESPRCFLQTTMAL